MPGAIAKISAFSLMVVQRVQPDVRGLNLIFFVATCFDDQVNLELATVSVMK